ncbi:aminoglycoside 6'-N-acetyltransferase [Chamaesiphon polymorphus]|uniref:Aminoglycoside N(6')-acetyltransferase type 1 n=1 Tax=Chamaesiphon polymorphus CCALA 037 TaxID=2107692 RepID=A0A2T1GK50_9CYAN|nr:aminoglycoside 6'-N-acetyltransferase [Chamaesiphon polymorphus]PSB58202.1 GNAT family N-acetyltransferase [Chamaesiphon polymorphus CCALA 037]
MKIVKIAQNDFNEWLDLALKLWPDYSSDEMQEILTEILDSDREAAFIVRDDLGKAIAFMNLSLRYEYVPEATQSPVGYIEGIYVKDEYRDRGVGKAMVEYAEQWALAQGCIELASDALVENTASHEFHTKTGFREAERTVYFIKSINLLQK